DLSKPTHFFQELGFTLNPQFSDGTTSCLIVSEHIYFLIMTKETFKKFSKKEVADTSTSAEAIFCLTAESREQVDETVQKALSLGGKTYSEPQDHGFMYIWGFQDLDGHLWEISY